MTKITLGLSGAVGHDPAAAIFVGNELIAAAEEERLIRKKHAKEEWPFLAARQVMQVAGIKAQDVDQIAIPYAPISLLSKARWHYAYRHWYAPDRSIDSLVNGNRRYRRYRRDLSGLLDKLHIPNASAKVVSVQHQLAHASSAYHMQEDDRKTAILCLDSKGEYSNVFIGYGHEGKIVRLKEFYNPDSLCGMYAALTDYLGFEILDGEFKVMGMAPYGDPNKYDLSSLASFDGKKFKVNNNLISTVGLRRYKAKLKGHYFSKKLVDMLGPRRAGNLKDDPYVHYAAAIQKLYEDMTIQIMESYLSDVLKESGRLAFAGTGSMNIRLNKRLAEHPLVSELVVHPACGDAGTAIGAAAYLARKSEGRIKKLRNVSLGAKFTTKQCIDACNLHREKPVWEQLEDPFEKAAELLANGQVIAWLRGPMEFGPRALGNRCILANPTEPNIVKSVNQRVKFREHWRPFSTSVLESCAEGFYEEDYSDEFMCVSQLIKSPWKEKYPFIASKDGTGRSQCVVEKNNPELHKLLSAFKQKSGHGILMNTALSRPGEALVCSPADALNLFMGTDLEFLIMEDILVTKREESSRW